MEHLQILELQTIQIEPSDKSGNLYKLVWMRVELNHQRSYGNSCLILTTCGWYFALNFS